MVMLVRAAIRATSGKDRAAGQDFDDNRRNLAYLIALQRPEFSATLSEQEYKNEGAKYGIEPAALHAFADVETSDAGFTDEGRLAILFEPHVFSRCSLHVHDGVVADIGSDGAACRVVFSYPVPFTPPKLPAPGTRHPYELNQTERWNLLAFAAELDFDAAIQATSWGKFQILGENWQALAYASAFDMVQQFYAGESAQLNAAIRFLMHHDALTAMVKGDWASVIEAWNGSGAVDKYLPKFLSRLDQRRSLYHV